MVGANIGGGEWLFGPLVTAQYGGRVLWLATIAILVQVAYNLSVMRYTLYTGETIFVGFFRTWPGPGFWTAFYLLFEIGGVWPYLSSNAAVPLASVILGRLPTAADGDFVRALGYGIFLACFLPLIFSGTRAKRSLGAAGHRRVPRPFVGPRRALCASVERSTRRWSV